MGHLSRWPVKLRRFTPGDTKAFLASETQGFDDELLVELLAASLNKDQEEQQKQLVIFLLF
jgi:hypothetical protein